MDLTKYEKDIVSCKLCDKEGHWIARVHLKEKPEDPNAKELWLLCEEHYKQYNSGELFQI